MHFILFPLLAPRPPSTPGQFPARRGEKGFPCSNAKLKLTKDNKELYGTTLFNEWANKDGLSTDEKFFIEKYLDRRGKTLEAGTGGGRIALGMQQLGFESLHGFDFVPEFIAQAKQRDTSRRILFEVNDARDLPYADASFDQIVYLQQVLCFIESDEGRLRALREASRILNPAGVALFSFLSFEGRRGIYLPFFGYLRAFRMLSRSGRRIQNQPWLKLDGKFNFNALLDRGPHIYWYKVGEAWKFLEAGGFTIVGAATALPGEPIEVFDSCEGLMNGKKGDGLYFVCRKS